MLQTTQAAKLLELTRMFPGTLSHERENCFPSVMACLLGLDDPEAMFQAQELHHAEHMGNTQTGYQLHDWLGAGGIVWKRIEGHRYNGSLYMVIGQSHRGTTHVCLYQNGLLVHDPHPDRTGLRSETYFDLLEPLA